MQKKGLSYYQKRNLIALSFIAPNFIGFAVFSLIPLVFSIVLSFAKWDASHPIEFVGLANFIRVFQDTTFQISLRNTIYYTVITVPVTMACSLLLALLLNRRLKIVTFARGVFFFPYIASTIAIAAVWNMMFLPSMGPINNILMSIGIKNPPGWFTSTKSALNTVIIVSVWRMMGYYMVMYLGGLQGIPQELYEAASVDGAGKIQQFWKITFPLLGPTHFFVSVMLVINCFKVFDMVLALTDGGPGRSTNVLVYYVYNKAFVGWNFGEASVASLVLLVMVVLVTVVQFQFEKQMTDY